jgi:hypothetical protein
MNRTFHGYLSILKKLIFRTIDISTLNKGKKFRLDLVSWGKSKFNDSIYD